MSYKVKLNVFEGPFDLLVYLIEHARMSIYDIEITSITTQYMEAVDTMKKADVNLASEFMVLAAALLEIKSRMLLPRASEKGREDGLVEDPRTQLVEKLIEYKKFKAVAEMLEKREEETERALEKPQEDLSLFTGEEDEYLSLSVEQFTAAFQLFLQRKKRLEEIRVHHRRSEKQRITTEARIEDIRDFFVESGVKEADFRELVKRAGDRYDTAVTFSSVLEMMKERTVDAQQKYIYGDITVKPTEALFGGQKARPEETPGESGEEKPWQAEKQ